jgi:hypothetical protein
VSEDCCIAPSRYKRIELFVRLLHRSAETPGGGKTTIGVLSVRTPISCDCMHCVPDQESRTRCHARRQRGVRWAEKTTIQIFLGPPYFQYDAINLRMLDNRGPARSTALALLVMPAGALALGDSNDGKHRA